MRFILRRGQEAAACECSEYSCDFLPPSAAFAAGGFCLAAAVACQLGMNWKYKPKQQTFRKSFQVGSLVPRTVLRGNTIAQAAYADDSSLMTLRMFFDCIYAPFFILGVLQLNFEIGYYAIFGWCLIVTAVLQKSFKLWNKEPVADKEKVIVYDVYQDITKGASLSMVIFSLQVLLGSYYAYAVFEGGRPCFQSQRVHGRYVFGAFLKALYSSSRLLIAMNDSRDDEVLWGKLQGAAANGFKVKDGNNKIKDIRFTRFQYFLSYLINNLASEVLFMLMNIEMANSGNGLDFVLNFAAVFTITEYDDLDDPGEYEFVRPDISKSGTKKNKRDYLSRK